MCPTSYEFGLNADTEHTQLVLPSRDRARFANMVRIISSISRTGCSDINRFLCLSAGSGWLNTMVVCSPISSPTSLMLAAKDGEQNVLGWTFLTMCLIQKETGTPAAWHRAENSCISEGWYTLGKPRYTMMHLVVFNLF